MAVATQAIQTWQWAQPHLRREPHVIWAGDEPDLCLAHQVCPVRLSHPHCMASSLFSLLFVSSPTQLSLGEECFVFFSVG